jgi:crotonobetainyl-CoA:carnitine CoA-transferase CaiB-like acyl-CoA transferase
MPSTALAGIRVLDLSRVLAAPLATQMLADLGAEVIKVERPGTGDDSRTYGPPYAHGTDTAAFYLSCNRNKQSVTVNHATAEGQELIRALAARSDVLVENFRAGTMERLSLGYEELSAINPRLVYCSVSAFGETGPLRDEAGYEAIMQAYSGVMSVTGEPEGDPVRCGLSFIDLTTGIISAYAVLGALLHRERTGQGQKIETSLLETAVSLLSYHAEAYLLDGTVPERLGSGHPSMVPYRNFQCRDGRFIFIAASNDRLWERLCDALELDHLLEDPRFGGVIGRVENRGELEDLVAAKVAEYDLDIIHEVLREGGVPAAPVNTVDRLMNEPQVEHRRMVVPVTHSTLGEISIIGQPMKFSAMEARKPAAPPAYGEHTDEILRELGYTDEDVSALRDKGVVR